MKISKLTALTMMLVLLFSACSKKVEKAELNYTVKEIDGVKVFSNKNEPSDKDLQVVLKEILTVNGYEDGASEERNIAVPMALSADKDENIYILDGGSRSVKKFNKAGEFIKSFCRQGTGPGEAVSVSALNIIKDTVVVADFNGQKLIKYDLNGNHITDASFAGNRTPVLFTPFNDKNFLAVVWYEDLEDNEYYVSVSLSIIDNKFNEIKILDTQKKKFVQDNFNIADLIGSYTVSGDNLFINSPSADKFYVSVFDHKGNILYGISKNYRRLMMSDKEVAEFNAGMKNTFGLNLSPVKIPKRSINGMYYDKLGRLWTLTAAERNEKNETTFYADLFKDGVYLNKIEIPQFKGSDFFDISRQIYFIGKYIYLVDMNNNQIKVYEY